MKKIMQLILLVCMTITLVACETKTKEFTKEGVTVTLPTSFKERKADNALVYYLSRKAMFMANRNKKQDYPPLCQYNDAQGYADKLRNDEYLQYNKKPADYSLVEKGNDGTEFAWLYYDNTVNKIEYSYMLVVKVAGDNVYIMNFASLKKDFEKLSSDFMEYAKSIKVAA